MDSSRHGMLPLTGTIRRRDLPDALRLPEPVIDALIESGCLLCHAGADEIAVPVQQLEAFFRDGLINLYRATSHGPAVVRPAADETHVEECVAPAPEPPMPMTASFEVAVPAKPIERTNARAAVRYIPSRQIGGSFQDSRFTILQLSATGLRIRHTEPFLPGDEGKLSFALLNPPRSFVVRARVVWTSVAHYEKGGETTFCISGLRVTEHAERLESAITILKNSHELRPDDAAASATRGAERPLEGVSDDEIALVVKAAQKFASDPVEASRWYGRGRFALSDEQVRREAPRTGRDREEVLGIWEYLDRQVEIPKIAGVLTWMHHARHADA